MEMTYRHAALFDLDGVLVDTEGVYTEFWAQIDREFPTGVEDFEHIIKGSTLARILDTYFIKADHDLILERLRRQEDEMQYRLFPNVLHFITGLRARGWGVAIVTSSNEVKMRHLFEQLPELQPLVDTLVTDGDVTHSKPDPEGYLLAARRLNCNPKDCTVFEDSLAGLEAGRRSGATVVGVATTNPRHALEGLADYIVDIVSEYVPQD